MSGTRRFGLGVGVLYAAQVGSVGCESAAEDVEGYDAPDEKSEARLAGLDIRA